jgi:hypothetical protein
VPAVLEADELPRDLVAIAAIGAHAEKPGQRHEAHEVEELAILPLVQIGVLVHRIEIGKDARTRVRAWNA